MPKRERPAAIGGELTKGPWTPLEDEILTQYVREHGEGDWNRVRSDTGIPRSGKSCRLRWLNHLRPDLKKGSFSFEEERLVLELHARFGNKWSLIAAQLPGRTDNAIKNFWNTRAKRYESNGRPLYRSSHAPIPGQTALFPAQNPDFPGGNVPVPPSFVQPNGNAALAFVQATPAFLREGSSLINDLPTLIQYANQSREMIAVPGFSPLRNADLEAHCRLPSCTHYLPSFEPVLGTTMPELPSSQHLQTRQGSWGEPSTRPLHQIVDTKQHPHPIAAESGLHQSIGLLPSRMHAPQSSKTANLDSNPRCIKIRTEVQSAWPAFMEQAQAPDSRESSLGSDSNPEARRIDATRPDALLGLGHFFS